MERAANFWKKWPLVTSRYRTERREIILTYANDLAWQSMMNRASTYPDGAMFAKVIMSSKTDEAFPSSYEPDALERFQFMLKDSKRFKEMNGWGYGLKGMEASLPPNNLVTHQISSSSDIEACHACHTLVSHRDFIFSRSLLASLEEAKLDHPGTVDSVNSPSEHNSFKNNFRGAPVTSLKGAAGDLLVNLLPANTNEIQIFKIKLFIGSEVESIMALGQLVREEKQSYLLLDEASGRFVLATPPQHFHWFCSNPVEIMFTDLDPTQTEKNKFKIRKGCICGDKTRWD
jgi:hypothetical protein